MAEEIELTDEGDLVSRQVDIAMALGAVILREGYGGIDHILRMLDDDPNFENAATYLTHLVSLENTSKWGIGEVLYFLRLRYSHVTSATFEYEEGAPFPEELYSYLEKTFSFNLRDALARGIGKIGGFLGWRAYRFHKLWLLVGQNEIRVWRKIKDDISDQEWEDTMASQLAPIVSKLNDRTAWAYYANVARLPDRDLRQDDLSWTYYYEVGNYVAKDVPPEKRGDERHEAIRDLMLAQVEEDIKSGSATVPNIRSRIAAKNRERRGYSFEFPPIGSLFVTDPNSGESWEAIHIADRVLQDYLLFHTRLATRDIPPRVSVEYSDASGTIYIDGKAAGFVSHRDQPTVSAAIDYLVNKLRWSVKDD